MKMSEARDQNHPVIMDDADTTNSTIKSSSISRSTSFSSMQSDDDYKSTSDQLEPLPTITTTGTVDMAKCAFLKQEPLPQRTNGDRQTSTSTTTTTGKRAIRYSKEFLEKLQKERSKFIDQIYPDIFRVYCYCMNGKYWNPEKYFAIVQQQFPDKLKKFNAKPHMQAKNQYHYYNPNRYNKAQAQQQQHQQQPQNFNQNKKQQKQAHEPSTVFNTKEQSNANKVLLDLIRNKHDVTQVTNPSTTTTTSEHTSSILNKLLMPKTPTQSPIKEEMTAKMLPPSWIPPPVPPSTPSTSLLDLLNRTDGHTSAYSNLLSLLNKESDKQQQQQLATTGTSTTSITTKNENIIKKLFGSEQPNKKINTNPFPTIKPHELPFQSVDAALSQILKSSSSSSSPSSSPTTSKSASSASSSSTSSPHRTMDKIFDKLKINYNQQAQDKDKEQGKQQQNENFNLLLSKITSNKPCQQSPPTNDILKWFVQQTQRQQLMSYKLPENVPVFTLKDIENRI